MAGKNGSGKDVVSNAAVEPSVTRFVIAHGDKGGVGKSMASMVCIDRLSAAGVPVAVVDADTQNPDVMRMFANEDCPRIALNLRATDGWMDLMDFVHRFPGYTFVLSTPAGIGKEMQSEFADFVRFLKGMAVNGRSVEVVVWWVMNLFPDSVNLLEQSIKHHGSLFDKMVIVRNGTFGKPEDFIFWNESPLKVALEKQKMAITVDLPPLHLRVMHRLMNPANVMPFSAALDDVAAGAIGFPPSEKHKLMSWLTEDVPTGMGQALEMLGWKAAV